MTRDPISPFPPVQLGSLIPWSDPNYIPSGPMRETKVGAALLPMPSQVPSQLGGPAPGASTHIDDAWHPATVVSAAVTPSVVTAADPQPFLLAPNTRRNLLMLRNASTGGQNIFVEFGKQASTDTVIFLVPNQVILLDVVCPQDDLYAACDVAGGRLVFGYSTIGNS